MKDIAFIFSVCLVLVLGLTSLDRVVDKVSASASRQAGHGLAGFFSSYEAALAAARDGERPVVLVFGRPGEAETERFKDEVLRSSQVSAVMERFVWAFIDAERDFNRSVVSRFDAGEAPLLTCLLDGTGRELRRTEGFLPAHAFLAELARCLTQTQEPSPAVEAQVTLTAE